MNGKWYKKDANSASAEKNKITKKLVKMKGNEEK